MLKVLLRVRCPPASSSNEVPTHILPSILPTISCTKHQSLKEQLQMVSKVLEIQALKRNPQFLYLLAAKLTSAFQEPVLVLLLVLLFITDVHIASACEAFPLHVQLPFTSAVLWEQPRLQVCNVSFVSLQRAVLEHSSCSRALLTCKSAALPSSP